MATVEKIAGSSTSADGKPLQRCARPECATLHEVSERVYVCSKCGSPLEIQVPLPVEIGASELKKLWTSRAASREPRDMSGVWRYRELLPFTKDVPPVTLFEGRTPLYEAPRSAKYCGRAQLLLKHQGCNPTGSFKDTGMTAAVTQAVQLGANTVVCASTGNTAASLAAYSARAGLQAAILLPAGQVSTAKLAQSLDYGAAVCEIEGNFDTCMRLIQELGEDPSIYVANSINPFRIEGQKTVAIEMMEQLDWCVPDHVVVPGGNMGNSSALGKGFEELLALKLIGRLPRLHVVQAEGAAPLARLFATLDAEAARHKNDLPSHMEIVEHPATLATAIKIGAPVSWQKSLRAVWRSGGSISSVTEEEIANAKAMVGRDGIGCEPASATTVAGLKKLAAAGRIRRDETAVAVLTGHILKDPDYVGRYHQDNLALTDANGAERRIVSAFPNAPARVEATKAAILENLASRR
jgi:threonine synthase